ncbi:MAG: 40S ribosomal protein S17 [Nitrosopumilus sp.]|nr:40S ribosomal protein S17 [Nitrosopumilus sp.]MDH3516841.1 40S ribosomal protein S17 [Nitrosopumilus sp.]MDH3565207.1 40S ribosomal protein S17 [Nitrosopumilus sp.]MDH5418602.1 40S ribosomal protein S17 [Nitrosopumilus sp.]MDH5555281.1 40S ribosomal protein S17 [Nitrosopumilus sp.]
MDRIKRLSYEVLASHKSKFGEDFADNKKALNQIAIVRSKGLKNKIAGYITNFLKKEIREEKAKQVRIKSSQSEEIKDEEIDMEITEPEIIEIGTDLTSADEITETTDEKSD